ncbi:hypothetical protein EVAR_55373_1 [Eumeta japonica]|uniref:Uncharacterized protein n=1 Tax=Eumeta variegata TaxID=151549 RepID=A0A4C1YY99_EUMVA|nr:hypothetical protein EVAR_55373_1 [Eumeta japonica]
MSRTALMLSSVVAVEERPLRRSSWNTAPDGSDDDVLANRKVISNPRGGPPSNPNLTDDPREGRPSTATTEDNTSAVRLKIKTDKILISRFGQA